jgi:hypothetical protein
VARALRPGDTKLLSQAIPRTLYQREQVRLVSRFTRRRCRLSTERVLHAQVESQRVRLGRLERDVRAQQHQVGA